MTEDELHDLVRVDPERAWPIVLEFVRDNSGSAVAQDLVEDFVYEHDVAFVSRIREAALGDPRFRDVVLQCHVGGFATTGADEFNRLQADLLEDID
jgi:hypothetical protein